jgi:hypothetical protein
MSELYDKVKAVLIDYNACYQQKINVLDLVRLWEEGSEDGKASVKEYLDDKRDSWSTWFKDYPPAWRELREILPGELKSYLDKYEPEEPRPVVIPEGEGWIPWTGGECPVGEHVRVHYLLRGGYRDSQPAGGLDWDWLESDNDIIAYKEFNYGD